MMKHPFVRFGIIGYGGFAERAVAPAMQSCPNARLVAIQKRSPAEARMKADQLGIPYSFSTAEELASHPEVDAVFVASANGAHMPDTLAAAAAGKHVLVEKPMANTVREAARMIETCAAAGVKLMVGHMVRLSPAVERLRALIAGGALGRVISIRSEFIYDSRLSKRSWLTDRTVAGGGPVYDIGVHCLDTMRFVLGSEITECTSHLFPAPTAERTEDAAACSFRFENGVLGLLYCSFTAPCRRSFIEVQGTAAIASIDSFTVGSRSTQLVLSQCVDGQITGTDVQTFQIPNLIAEEIQLFADCILNNTPVPVSGEEGMKNVQLIEDIVSIVPGR